MYILTTLEFPTHNIDFYQSFTYLTILTILQIIPVCWLLNKYRYKPVWHQYTLEDKVS